MFFSFLIIFNEKKVIYLAILKTSCSTNQTKKKYFQLLLYNQIESELNEITNKLLFFVC